MIKDKRKTKENSKNQEQFINWIKEYFAEAPITITNDKTKLYITHNEYPISLENTSIIERFTNKNKGIEFTREQATKEAERLRNELALSVKNYKMAGIYTIQNLIKEHLKETFEAKNITDIKFINDFEAVMTYQDFEINIDYNTEASYLFNSYNISMVELSDFENAIDIDKYNDYITAIVGNIVASDLEKLEGTGCSIDFSDYEINICYENRTLEEVWLNEGYNFTVADTIDYVATEVKSIVKYILNNFKEQEECAKYAEENYKKDIIELLHKTGLTQHPDIDSDSVKMYANGFYGGFDFKLEFEILNLGHYEIEISSGAYEVFEINGFYYHEDTEYTEDNCDKYLSEVPWSESFDYEAFLDIVEEKLNKVKEEILEDLSK
ncbi:hypothetical protein [Enterococcus faecalis]|uniref:hypothetical protein n=1 Tax=Enterococcus faecalis TaxID=1351 RepID=UPI003CC5AB7F